MIPEAFITEWSRQAPWPTDTQIEHDLILSRLMVEIANNPVLGPEFAMGGGACLHKLHLPEPYRYSEDLDYVRRTHSGIKPYMDALRSIVTGVGLIEHGYQQVGQMVHMIFDAEPTSGVGRIRVKIETNVREVESFGERRDHPFSVQSSWWQGKAEIPTFSLEELMGTKLRALYQRRKGRDLFDLWLALHDEQVDGDRIVGAFHHYMGEEAFGFRDLADNLIDKLTNSDFQDDLTQLILEPPRGYDPTAAADMVMEQLGSRLRGAPDLSAIADGEWRAER